LEIVDRGVAQPGSAPALGAGCRRFKSSHPDQHQDFYRITAKEGGGIETTMDNLGGRWVMEVTPDAILEHLRSHPNDMNLKRGSECLAACVLEKCFANDTGHRICIYFVFRSRDLTRRIPDLTVEQLLHDGKWIDDQDVDFWLGTKESRDAWQVVRVEPRSKGETGMDKLFNTIRRKYKVQPDNRLGLAILVDENFELQIDPLCDFIERLRSPYVRVVLIGQVGPSPSCGEFTCLSVYPSLEMSGKVVLPLNTDA
jgi:hypothetical protein